MGHVYYLRVGFDDSEPDPGSNVWDATHEVVILFFFLLGQLVPGDQEFMQLLGTIRLDGISTTLWPFNSYDIDVLTGGSHHFVKELAPQETTDLSFNVSADHTGWAYLHVTAKEAENGVRFQILRRQQSLWSIRGACMVWIELKREVRE